MFAEAIGIDHAIVFGHSLGSRVGQAFAALYPARVDALVLTAPHLSNFLLTREDAKAVLGAAALSLQHPEEFATREDALAYMRPRWPWSPESEAALEHRITYNFEHRADGSLAPRYDVVRVSQGLAYLSHDMRPYAKQVKCPVMIMRAASGKLSPEQAVELAAFWSNSTIVDVDGVYAVQLDNPAGVAQVLKEYAAETVK